MLRSPWFWLTLLLIAAGVALTSLLGVFEWFALTLGVAIAVLDGILLYASYRVPRVEAPDLPELEPLQDQEPIPVIQNCDVTMGHLFRDVGDGLALLYLLGEPRVDLRGVTTTYGNGPTSMTTRTARGILRELDMDHLVVVPGARGPNQRPEDNQAARYLVEAVSRQPNEITVLASGAMTNLRHARALDKAFFRKLRSLYLVGGTTGEVTWNRRPLLERNFSLDPDGAYEAIQAECPRTVVIGEAGLTAVFRSKQLATLRALDDPVSQLIMERTRIWFGLMKLWFRDGGFAMWEPLAATAIARPDHLRFQRVYLPTAVEDLKTGKLVTDPDRTGPVRLVRGVADYEGFMAVQLAAWHRLGRFLETKRSGGP